MRLSDSIETFIKTLLAEDEPEVELKNISGARRVKSIMCWRHAFPPTTDT